MGEAPSKEAWLTIVGLGEDGLDGLAAASRRAIEEAEVVMGPPRHLKLLPKLDVETVEWPVPFSDGIEVLNNLRGRRVVALASGDPFWFGAGTVIAQHLPQNEWQAFPAASTFSLAAARLGWAIDTTLCLGLHAAPIPRIRPHLAPGVRAILLLRNGEAVSRLSAYLTGLGFGESRVAVLEALGGPRERISWGEAKSIAGEAYVHPVALAVEVIGEGQVVPVTCGIDNGFFETDGQISKRPMRALALSALAPRPFETLWDIGGGSGSIAIEWLLAHPTTQAYSIEMQSDRAARIRSNAERLGVDRLNVVEGKAPDALDGLNAPDTVFIGGGLSEMLLNGLATRLATGTRLVAHAVTLESEALLSNWSERLGGSLLKAEFSEAVPLGSKRGWRAAYPVTQWSVIL